MGEDELLGQGLAWGLKGKGGRENVAMTVRTMVWEGGREGRGEGIVVRVRV